MNQFHTGYFDQDLLEQIRERFCWVDSDLYSGDRIYFENAGGSLTLKSVVAVTSEQTALPDNAGRPNPASQAITQLITNGRDDIRAFANARSGVVFMGESTTSLAFRIIDAITRAVPGSNVVTTNLDHPAVYDATRWVAEKYRKEWRVAGLDPTKGVVTPTEIARHIDANTSLLAIIHSSNNLGTTNDVESIAREARKAKPDLYVLVDGSQYIAHFPLDVEALWCDAYITSTYKTFSRVGASFAFLSDRTARLPHERLLGTPETTWELGTRDQSCYAAWSKVVEYLAWLGSRFTSDKGKRETIVAAMKGIEEHERALTHRLLHGTEQDPGLLKTPGVTVYPGSVDLPRRQPVVAMNVAGRSSGQVVKILSDRGIRVTSRQSDYYSRHTLQALGIEECVRVSLAHYNTPEEVDVFLKAMSELPR